MRWFCMIAVVLLSSSFVATVGLSDPDVEAGHQPPPAASPQDAPVPADGAAEPAATQPAATPTPPASPPSWMPAEVGRRWSYVYVRERTRTTDAAPPTSEQLHGILTEEIAGPAPEFGADAVELVSTLEAQAGEQTSASSEKHRTILAIRSRILQEMAREGLDPVSGLTQLEHFSPPIDRIRYDAPAGTKWRMGAWKTEGLNAEYFGEILGVQDAKTPAGVFEKCLVVRYSAKLAGVVEVGGTRFEIRDGQVVSTEWYAPGIGRVLMKRELQESMILSNGSQMEFSESVQAALRDAGRGEGQSAEPAPASPPALTTP